MMGQAAWKSWDMYGSGRSLESLRSCAVQGWTRGVRGTELFQMLQESFAWLPSTGFPTADPNMTLAFPVVVAALAASSHTAQASPAPSRCYVDIDPVHHEVP